VLSRLFVFQDDDLLDAYRKDFAFLIIVLIEGVVDADEDDDHFDKPINQIFHPMM